jgi:hypothetical protein
MTSLFGEGGRATRINGVSRCRASAFLNDEEDNTLGAKPLKRKAITKMAFPNGCGSMIATLESDRGNGNDVRSVGMCGKSR